MWIGCWKCGQDLWAETQKVCRHCEVPSHRCSDCEHYDESGPSCLALNIELAREEAEHPTRLSQSANCSEYEITHAALQRRHAHEGEPRHHATPPKTAATAPSAPAAAPPAPASAEGDFITIRREPPLKHPAHPVIIAHRGESSGVPENTLSAFAAALASGANGIEFDVHLTSDNHPVVFHDATVDRCTDGTGPIAAMTLKQVKALDAGSWFAEPYEGERVPTLAEAIAAIAAPAFMVMHLRAHENETDRCERALFDAIVRHDCRKRTVITHHTRHGLQRLRDMDPLLRLCWIPCGLELAEEYIDDAYLLGCRFVQPKIGDINEHFVQYAHDKGMWINAFWADEIEDMERMIALKVDGIITNYPRRLKETLQGR